MNNTDKTNFAKLLTSLAELHNKRLSSTLLNIYWHALKNYDYQDIIHSLNLLIVDPDVGQFMPKPADIVRYIEGNKETKAMLAWSKVMQAIRQFGAWESVQFDDHKIHAVIMDMGGWIALCRKTTKELDFLSREFYKRYQAYQYNHNACPKKLIGKIEAISQSQGFNQIPELKLIGRNINDLYLENSESIN